MRRKPLEVEALEFEVEYDREFEKMKTVDELAALMGVHRQTILRYIRSRKLQAVRFGNRYRIPNGAYRRFMLRNETYEEFAIVEPYRD